MTDSPDRPTVVEPGSEATEEVQDLLDQAETLTNAIVEDGGPPPEQVEEADSESMTAEADSPPETEDEAPVQAEGEGPETAAELNDLLNDPEKDDQDKSRSNLNFENRPPPQPEQKPTSETAAQPKETERAEPQAEQEVESDTAEAQEPKSPKNRFLAAPIAAMAVAKAGTCHVLAASLNTMILLDRPFATMSMRVKRMIGILGLATILAGIASHVVPPMLSKNPFKEMERQVIRAD